MSLLLLFSGGGAAPAPSESYAQAVTARLLDYDGTEVTGDPLANAFDLEFYDERNGPGTGKASLSLSDAGAAQLLPGRYVDIMLNSNSRFTFKIEGNPEYKVIEAGEEHDQIIVVAGRGWACIMDDAIVYPEVDFTLPIDTTWRLFSFASESFPRAGTWSPAVELYEWLDGVAPPDSVVRGRYVYITTPPGSPLPYPAPVNFPWPISSNNYDPVTPPGVGYEPTYWIWSESGYSTDEFGLGWCFFRNSFTIAADTIVTFAVSGDNFFTFFLEGVPILGEDADHYIWQGWKEIPIALTAGTYHVAAFVENTPTGLPGEGVNQNPGGFIATVTSNDSDNVPVDSFLVTDSSWECLFVPAANKWPGWTPGEIVNKLVLEATSRGAMAVYAAPTFTAATDSEANAWLPLDTTIATAEAASFAVEVGSTVMDAMGLLYDQGWIEWHVQPGTWVLDVYRGRIPSPSSSATLAAGVNLMALSRSSTAPYANALLVQYDGGYLEVPELGSRPTAAMTSHGTVVEAIFSSDATNRNDAKQAGTTELIRRVQSGYPSVLATVEPTGPSDAPYEAYETGDWVTIPAVGGGTEIVRVLSIKCTQDAEGWAVWGLELNAKLNVPERRRADLMRQIGGRTGVARGTVK